MQAILALCSLGKGFHFTGSQPLLNHHQSRSYPLRKAKVGLSLAKMLVMTLVGQWENDDLLGCWMRLVEGVGKIPDGRLEE